MDQSYLRRDGGQHDAVIVSNQEMERRRRPGHGSTRNVNQAMSARKDNT
jgi:hypothetical protein